MFSSPDPKSITSLKRTGLYSSGECKRLAMYKHSDIRKNIDQGNLAQIEIIPFLILIHYWEHELNEINLYSSVNGKEFQKT